MVKKWIQKADLKKGALHKEMGIPTSQRIPAVKLAQAAKAAGIEGKRAKLAETFRHMKKK